MDTILSQKLANYVNALRLKKEFIVYDTIDGNYNHMGATVADAVLQANLRYKTHVEPRVERIRKNYPDAISTSAVLQLLESIPTTEFLFWRGKDRADRFDEVIRLFKSENIETENDLKRLFNADQSGILEQKLLCIKGIGQKTVDYFKILIGISTSAIDRHLLNFLEAAEIHNSNYNEAQEIINSAADYLKIDRAIFDHSIWQYMSNRPAASPLKLCKAK